MRQFMGFVENDRIKSKNKHIEQAFAIYGDLLKIGFSDIDVVRYAKLASSNTSDPFRNKIFNTIISIIGRKDVQGPKDSN